MVVVVEVTMEEVEVGVMMMKEVVVEVMMEWVELVVEVMVEWVEVEMEVVGCWRRWGSVDHLTAHGVTTRARCSCLDPPGNPGRGRQDKAFS